MRQAQGRKVDKCHKSDEEHADFLISGKLTRLSDVAFLAWLKVCAWVGNCDGLGPHYIVRSLIINTGTQNIMHEARSMVRVQADGIATFDTSTLAGKALLGSDHGLAAGWMIIDHPKTFYAKRVREVISGNPSTSNSLVFVIKDILNSG